LGDRRSTRKREAASTTVAVSFLAVIGTPRAIPEVTVECTHVELWSGGGIRVESRRCDYGSEAWTDSFESRYFSVLLPVTGAYRVRADGVTQFVNPGCGTFRRPGLEVVGSGISRTHASTALYVDVHHFDAVDGADWPSGELFVDARLDLHHRLLRRDLRAGVDPGGIEMRAVDVLAGTLAMDVAPARRPPATSVRHRQITAEVLEALDQSNGSFSLTELSRTVGCSPFHLSRIFHQTTGVTLRQHQTRVRLRAALDLLDQGMRDLTWIAATCGFADNSHLTRTANAHLGTCPSRLRELLHHA
jgi:AraC-like DNA-binding protein